MKSIENTEDLIQRGMDKLNRLAIQITALHQSLEKKETDRQAECSRQRQANSTKEQQLAAKEAELAEREKTLEIQKPQQDQQTEKRLKDAEDRHRGELEAKDRDIQLWQSKEKEAV